MFRGARRRVSNYFCTLNLLAMPPSKPSKSKSAWDQAHQYAAKHGISVREARTKLAQSAKSQSAKKSPSTSQSFRKFDGKTSKDNLAQAERELRLKYPHIVAGSLKAHTSGPHKGRRTVEIICQSRGCENKRKIHTSDAFQVTACLACSKARNRS
jgi:hypothetical protein